MSTVLIAALRAIQMIFGIICLALSVQLARGQLIGNAPSTTIFDAFAGGFTLVAAIVCLAGLAWSALAGKVSFAVDTVAALAALAGGIATVVELRGVTCGTDYEMYYNSLINGGLENIKGEPVSGLTIPQMTTRCNMNKADSAFLFLAFVISSVLLVLSFTNQKLGTIGGRTYV